MPPDRWQQHNIIFADRQTAQRVIAERLPPTLRAAEEDKQLTGWWFMNKQPWPLRYLAHQPSPIVEALLNDLVTEGIAGFHAHGIYEPETEAFGGPQAMTAAHGLFHEDSRHLLGYQPARGHLGRRETAVLLMSAMMRAAGLDWFEQGDVWAKVSDLRPATEPSAPDLAPALAPAMQKLVTADAHSLCRAYGPLSGHSEWVAAFECAGTILACLSAHGSLTRGLRAVVAHHMIFHANRAGLPSCDQHAMSRIARKVVMGSSETPRQQRGNAPAADTVGAMNTDTIAIPEAERLRNALVDQIQADGHARTPAVEAALRTVPRHLFVPDASLSDAYANAPVDIKYDTDGTSISCASQPGVVALMLDQLEAQPGERILELGAGTGYNAALLGHLVGPRSVRGRTCAGESHRQRRGP